MRIMKLIDKILYTKDFQLFNQTLYTHNFSSIMLGNTLYKEINDQLFFNYFLSDVKII